MHDTILEILNRHYRDADFSGVCLVRTGNVDVVHQAFGFAHRGFAIPNERTTRFDIASVTKLFTAAAIMRLVDEGQLTLETRVMPFLDIGNTNISENVSVYHCLTHTSGIGDDADEEAGEDYELLFADKPNYSIRESVDFLPQCTSREPNFPPGSGVRYNNCAFVLLGLVIEKVTNMSYRDFVRQQVFAPAGMETADFCAMDGVNADFAEHYKRIDGPNGDPIWRKNIYSYPPVGSPDGGATVTAEDLARFFRAVLNNQLMSASASRKFITPQVRHTVLEVGSEWYGFAFQFDLDSNGKTTMFGKDGINAGVASIATYHPRIDTTCVILANQDCDVWAMHDELVAVIG